MTQEKRQGLIEEEKRLRQVVLDKIARRATLGREVRRLREIWEILEEKEESEPPKD